MIKKITIFLLGWLFLFPNFGQAAAADSNIVIDMDYLVVSPGEDESTNMMNMVNYSNPSDQDYKGDGQGEAVLKVTLPKGIKDLNFSDSKIAFKQTETGFITTTPIPANQTMVLPYSYRVEKGKEINLTVDYSVQLFQILVPEGMGSIEIKGTDYTSQGLFKFDDQNYWGYSIENIKANQTFTIFYNKDIQPKSDTALAETDSTNKSTSSVTRTAPAFHNPGHLRMWAQSPLHRFNPHVFLIIMGAIVIAGVSYYIYFRRKARFEQERLGADKEEKAFKLLMSKQKAIMDKIIELEETFGDGKLTENEYQAKLNAYKQHLVQVKLSLREFIE
ncbi:hypothetical protein [Neobacillus dielmonensis]|uniref:hypothetical protein n=1 Tax=Neobacillus dielmonensis TaxID=1347369 RepID=UPI0005A7E361|nr:hypothetical protein [Neobacillus dielmonensis]